MSRRTGSLESEVARFMARSTRTENGCLMGPQKNSGYGALRYYGRQVTAHRAVYTAFNGPIPAGMVIRHTCDHIGCVEPTHLIIGTNLDNVRDAVERGLIKAGDDHPHSYPRPLVEEARNLYAAGELTKAQIADRLDVPFHTVDKWTKGTVRSLEPMHVRDGRFKPTGQGCGTRAGYDRHGRLGEKPCDGCRQANTDYMRAYKAARRAAA